MARKATEIIVQEKPAIDEAAVNGAFETARQNVLREQQETASETFSLGRFVGAAQMASAMRNFSAVAEVRAFDEVRKSKAFKHIPVTHPNGEVRTAENIDEFSRLVFGRGYKSMMENSQALERLGADSFDAVNSLGISRAQMRLLIALPEDERAAVNAAVKSGEKLEVVSLIQDLANKLDETRSKVEDLKAQAAATDRVLSDKSALIDQLQIETGKKPRPASLEDTADPLFNEALKALHEATDGACNAITNLLSKTRAVMEAAGDDERRDVVAEKSAAFRRVFGFLRYDAELVGVPLVSTDLESADPDGDADDVLMEVIGAWDQESEVRDQESNPGVGTNEEDDPESDYGNNPEAVAAFAAQIDRERAEAEAVYQAEMAYHPDAKGSDDAEPF